MKKLILSIFILLATLGYAQVPTPVRSVSVLPATCNGGSATVPSDVVTLVSGGVGALEVCTAPNTWTASGGGGGGPISIGAGYAVVSSPTIGSNPVNQLKPAVDVRDYRTFGDGTTAHTLIQSDITNNTQWFGCGTATSVGTALTWNTGAKFYPTLAGYNINFNGADYNVSSLGTVTGGSATTLTLGSS